MAHLLSNNNLLSDLSLFFLPDDESEPLQERVNNAHLLSPKQEDLSQTITPTVDHPREYQIADIKQEEFSQTLPAETDLDHVREFFDYSLPPHLLHNDHSTSTSTRPPARFDLHLDDHLRLKRVVYLPSLVTDLEAIADQALADYMSVQPLPPTLEAGTWFPNRIERQHALTVSPHDKLVNEKSVEEVYLQTLARHCGIVASTLEFQLPVWSPAYLEWTTNHRSDENYAIADGFLKLVAEPTPLPDDPCRPLPVAYSKLREDFPVLGVWEFKSLKVGAREVFEVIREFARKAIFPWVGCNAGELCASQHSPDSVGPLKTWSKLGPDAKSPVSQGAISHPQSPPVLPEPSRAFDATEITRGVHMLQQGFAESVKHDTTFGCLNAGRYEMYWRRDRATSTIYITDIIETDSPGRARVLTGLFIAIIRDAMDRSAQLRRSLHPPTWRKINPYDNLHIIHVLSPEDMLAEAITRPWLKLVAQDKKSPPPSFCPNSLYLRISAASVEGPHNAPNSNSIFHIIIPSQRHVSRGVLKISDEIFRGIEGRFSSSVIVKTANHDRIIKRMMHEYEVYVGLATAGVACIPDVVGLFSYTNSESNQRIELNYLALILEDVGIKSLAEIWEEEGNISRGLMGECLQALNQIHAAGYLYGSEFSLHHIIVREKGLERSDRFLVSFISLGDAFRVTEQWCKRMEVQRLLRYLRNPRKREAWSNGLEFLRNVGRNALEDRYAAEEDVQRECASDDGDVKARPVQIARGVPPRTL